MEIIGLIITLIVVLVLPLTIHKVERNLELFLFIMGIFSVTITNNWSLHIIKEALIEPIKITLAVLIAGILFMATRNKIRRQIEKIMDKTGYHVFLFLIVIVLGLASSIITAIIASLVLVEIVSSLKLNKKAETNFVILSCFSIGLGAALTPIGEPLSTIAIAKLKGEPHNANFWYLTKILGIYIIPAIVLSGLIASRLYAKHVKSSESLQQEKPESISDIIIRTIKVYVFVMALIFLGKGFEPVIDKYIIKLSSFTLYWINMISAILDNATLTAAEIGVNMNVKQIQCVLIGLLISGVMLIPGNIPNIITAGKLRISSKEWAKFGVPLGLSFMVLFFLILFGNGVFK